MPNTLTPGKGGVGLEGVLNTRNLNPSALSSFPNEGELIEL